MSRSINSSIWDSPQGYGLVSRILHWLMAVLFALQFFSAILRIVDRNMPMTKTVWGIHYTLGFTLMLLLVLRAVWGLLNLRNRPPHGHGLIGLASLGGHIALYVLMIFVPIVGLVRVYAGGKGYDFFGLQIFGQGPRNEALRETSGFFHAPAGWIMLALIGGHILMVFVHKYLWREDVLGRMTRGRQVAAGRTVEQN